MPNVTDVARFGLVIDGTGAQRQVKLTTEELKKLANGGREAEQVMKSLGNPQLAQRIQTSITAPTMTASTGVGKLRGSLTTLAISAGALPGPIGRLASALGPLAVGGGVTVAVLAGITAISFAFDKMAESSRVARERAAKDIEYLKGLGEEKPTVSAREAIARAENRLTAVMRELRTVNTAIRSGTNVDAIDMAAGPFREDVLRSRRTKLVAEANDLVMALATGATFVGKAFSDAAKEMRRTAGAALTIPFGTLPSSAVKRAGEPTFKPLPVPDRFGTQSYGAFGGMSQYEWTRQQQIDAAKFQLKDYGLGLAAQAAGPFGGLVGGVGSGLMTGNPFAAAASGVTGLISGIISLGQRSRETARAMEDFLTAQRLAVGDITQKEADAKAIGQAYADQRRLLETAREHILSGTAPGQMRDTLLAENQKKIDDLNALERKRLELLGKEADAVERINSAVRNAPSGFYVEKYLRRIGYMPPESDGAHTGPRNRRNRPNTGVAAVDAIVIETAVIQLPAGTPGEQVRALAQELRRIAKSTGGAGMVPSEAWNVA